MKRTPRYTQADLARFSRPYVKAESTDVTKTWRAAQERMEANKLERAEVVREIKPRKKA